MFKVGDRVRIKDYTVDDADSLKEWEQEYPTVNYQILQIRRGETQDIVVTITDETGRTIQSEWVIRSSNLLHYKTRHQLLKERYL